MLKEIPAVDIILDEAIEKLKLSGLSRDEILRHFESHVANLEAEAFNIYLGYEEAAFAKLARSWLRKAKPEKKELGEKSLLEFVKLVREMEARAGQMRKARGGASFQKIVKKLLNLAGVPCEEPSKDIKRLLRRIDLVSPDAETAKNAPDKAIFLAAKRTLRERWKQVVPEQMKGTRLYLITINSECSSEKAQEIKETGMIAYVPQELKEKEHKDKPWIRSLTKSPKDIRNTIRMKKELCRFQGSKR
jgi:hypothetical protein